MMAAPGTGELTAALTVCAALVTAACAWLAVLLMILPAASSVLFAVFLPFSAMVQREWFTPTLLWLENCHHQPLIRCRQCSICWFLAAIKQQKAPFLLKMINNCTDVATINVHVTESRRHRGPLSQGSTKK